MNTWLNNFSEYKGLLNPICITCGCKDWCYVLDFNSCNGKYYIQDEKYNMKEQTNETESRT